MKNKIILGLLVICGLSLLGTGIYFQFFNKEVTNDKNNENEVLITHKLRKDFEEGKITVDEYVKYNLYAEYDTSLLKDEYSSFQKNQVAIHTDELIDEYYDELSDETLKYYIEKINLDNITFELDKENKQVDDDSVALADIFVEDVYAKEENVTNLNKVVLSSGGNFVVWYTTTGDSAITKNEAQKVANDLEKTVQKYNDFSSNDFNFEGNILSKGKTYDNQKEILENQDIDVSYLEDAMQVYVVEYSDDSIAKYIQGYGGLLELFNTIRGGDSFGSIAFPYILLRPSSFDDYERLSQLYNHELFHYYQHNVLCGSNSCQTSKDPYITEATANWASSLVTNKTNNTGFLNEWSGIARTFSSNLMSDEWSSKYGIENVGYALHIYLYNYTNLVNNGTSKIIESIYKDNSLEYLQDNAIIEELAEIQSTIAYKNFSQDYSNKNLNVDLNFNADIKLKETINKGKNIENVTLNKLGIDYYLIDMEKGNTFELELIRDNKNVIATIIGEKDGVYELLENSPISSDTYIFDASEHSGYSKFYLAISNSRLTNTYTYNIKIKQVESKNEENKTDTETSNDKVFKTTFDNYRIRAYSTIEVYGYTTSSVIEGAMDEKHQKEYLKTTTETMGIEVVMETYSDFDKGYTYSSVPFTSMWEKGEGATQFIDLANIMEKLEKNGDVTKISDSEYKIKLTSEDVKGLMNSNDSTSTAQISGNIYVNAFVTDGYITKLEYDFSGLIEGIDKFTMTIEFSDFNNAGDVEIPSNITK